MSVKSKKSREEILLYQREYSRKRRKNMSVEQKSKYKYLQDKFKIELKKLGDKDVDEVTNSVA